MCLYSESYDPDKRPATSMGQLVAFEQELIADRELKKLTEFAHRVYTQ